MTVASPPPPPGAPVPAKKGMGPLGWIAIGCGAIVLIGILVFGAGAYMFKKKVVDPFKANPTMAAAELIVGVTPDLERVSSDPEKGTITVKNTKTGEILTVDASETKESGKITFKTDEGTTVVDASQAGDSGGIKVTGADGQQVTFGGQAPKDLPSWVPIYPGADVQAAMDATNPEGRSASFTVTTDDSIDEVMSFYESKLGEAGLKVSKNAMESNGERSGLVTGTSEDDLRTVNATISQQDGKTQALVFFTSKK
jgi:hypothetical protein